MRSRSSAARPSSVDPDPGLDRGGGSVIFRAPASTANLGPGFDCAGCALDLWNELEVTDGSGVEIVGEGADELPRDETHLALQAFARFAPVEGRAFRFLNRIPLARGLGSSASAIALGLVAGAPFAERETDPEELLGARDRPRRPRGQPRTRARRRCVPDVGRPCAARRGRGAVRGGGRRARHTGRDRGFASRTSSASFPRGRNLHGGPRSASRRRARVRGQGLAHRGVPRPASRALPRRERAASRGDPRGHAAGGGRRDPLGLRADGARVDARGRRRAAAPRSSRRSSRRRTCSRCASPRWERDSSREVPVRRLPLGARQPGARARALPRGSHPGRVVPRRRDRALRARALAGCAGRPASAAGRRRFRAGRRACGDRGRRVRRRVRPGQQRRRGAALVAAPALRP